LEPEERFVEVGKYFKDAIWAAKDYYLATLDPLAVSLFFNLIDKVQFI
jgi:hypothetical protein